MAAGPGLSPDRPAPASHAATGAARRGSPRSWGSAGPAAAAAWDGGRERGGTEPCACIASPLSSLPAPRRRRRLRLLPPPPRSAAPRPPRPRGRWNEPLPRLRREWVKEAGSFPSSLPRGGRLLPVATAVGRQERRRELSRLFWAGPALIASRRSPDLPRRPVAACRLVPPRLAGGGSAAVSPAAAAAAAAGGGGQRTGRQRGG